MLTADCPTAPFKTMHACIVQSPSDSQNYVQANIDSTDVPFSDSKDLKGSLQHMPAVICAMSTAKHADRELCDAECVRGQWPTPLVALSTKSAGLLLLQGAQSLPRDWILSTVDSRG